MVKGISRQVIVVHPSETKLFEQAIFILKEDAVQQGLSDEMLMKEAIQASRLADRPVGKRRLYRYGAFWAAVGSGVTCVLWLLAGVL